MSNKRTDASRKIFAYSLIIVIAILSGLFIYQFYQYKKVQSRLNFAYASGQFQSPILYKLFSTYSEADYSFRLYAINFEEKDLVTYTNKLNTIKMVIDSLASLPIKQNPINSTSFGSTNLASEYIILKKQIDNLVFYANDTIKPISDKKSIKNNVLNSPKITITDSVISRILSDTSQLIFSQDTLVKKRGNLFKRIFKSKDDTIVFKNINEVLNKNQIDIVQRNIDNLIISNEKVYRNNLINLRNIFQNLKVTEKKLLLSNFELLHNLKLGIEKLRELEFENYQNSQEEDFALYNTNVKSFWMQLIFALALLILMIIIIVNYQNKVLSYERKLMKEKDYASKIAEEKTNLLANISHEIRTPLNSLKGIIDLLKADNKSDIIDTEIIDSVDYDITVINNTINDILNLSKLEAGALDIKLQTFSPHQLLNEVIGIHQYQIKTKGLNFTINNNIPKTLLINSNAFRIRQIISNLLTNAIKYTNKGSVSVEGSIVENKGDSSISITVLDTGVGIPSILKNQIFRKYYVAKSQNSAGGFGLGLYISKLLAQQIQGNISFESEINKGTIFTFEFPIGKIKVDKSTQRNQHLGDIPEDKEIVFIDDSRINLFFIQQFLKNKPNVHYFNNAQVAWEYIQKNKPHIVITDLKMPDLDGWEILENIKSNQQLIDTKVYVCTAELMLLGDISNKNSLYQFDGILKKPLKESNLLEVILKE